MVRGKYVKRVSVGMSQAMVNSVEIHADGEQRSFEDMVRVLLREALAARRVCDEASAAEVDE